MTDYVKSVNFAAKDDLPSGDTGKVVRGTEINTELNNIATAVNSKANTTTVTSGLATKQDTLVSGTDIKTLSSTSLLGAGDIALKTVGGTSLIGAGDVTLFEGESLSVIATNTNAVANNFYVFTATLTLTLPASPTAGDTVGFANRSGTTTPIIARNGEPIMGDPTDLTIDNENYFGTLIYVDGTRGWVFK